MPGSGDWSKVQGTEGLSAGVLDPIELARMANEFFTSLPEAFQPPLSVAPAAPVPPGSPVNVNPYAAVPAPTPPAFPGLFSSLAAEQPVVLPTRDRGAAPTGSVPSPSNPVPAIPGGVSTAVPSPVPAFSFLQDARPLFAEPVAEPPVLNTPARAFQDEVPSDAGFAAIPSSLFTDVSPSQLTELAQPPTPTVPGSFGKVDSSAVPAFSFMEEARPLFSTPPTVPGPAPASPVPSQLERSAHAEDLSATAANPFASPLDPHAPQLSGAVAHEPDYRAPASYDPRNQPRSLSPENTVPAQVPVGARSDLPYDLNLSSYSFDVEAIRRDFPILRERVNGRPLIWFDNAATTQKPQSVIDRLKFFYEHENSNVHRAAHELAARATDAYESAREKTRRFLNAGAAREIVFVRGATEAINLVAQSWGRRYVQKDDEIVITWLEHHANIVPWQMLCAEKGARLRVAPVDDTGQVVLEEYEKLLGPKTRLVSISQVSNALGTVTPVGAMIEAAHRHGARVLIDGAQAVSHMRVDVQALDCDFYVFSGHKVFAPTGIGVVYGKSEVLDNTPPWQGGGNMIQDVTFEKTLYQLPPQRFEAGTGSIADAVGLGAALDYVERVGMENISRYEHMLLVYATEALQRIPGLRIIGTAKEKAGVLSFVMDGFRTEEIGDFLNRKGIAVRGGHHCAQPIHRRFGLESTLRASLALYNTCEEVDALVAALWDLRQGRNPGII
jgi:cysteine desulfurase/selenocysteine lyase